MNSIILIIYPYTNQEFLVHNMVMSLRENNINADAFNSSNFRFSAPPLIKPSFRIKILGFMLGLPIPKINGLIFKLIDLNKEIIKFADCYSLIDFHVFTKIYDEIINHFLTKKVVKITIWGSDFYRVDDFRREQQRAIYKKCDSIQLLTKNMKSDFVDYYKDFEKKIKIANFGVIQFNIMDEVKKKISGLPKFKNVTFSDKLTIVCGYNGSEAQQHKIIINALNQLDLVSKEKIFLIFPMTYGGDKKYIKKVEHELELLNIPFLLLKDLLTNKQIAQLRLETDIVINIQITDAFSGSLQEHLYAENLLLTGEWLPYSILDENQIYYRKCTLKNISSQISDCINNFDLYKKDTIGNREKMYNLSSWNVAGKKMSSIYKELQKSIY